MAITQVFPNPTVKQVIFQIKFDNLFFIESKIGDLQAKIMDRFPQSSLVFSRQLVFANLGPEGKIESGPEGFPDAQGKKIWQFKSEQKFKLNITSDSLDISSEFHKTYNNSGASEKFRDIIQYVLDNFFSIISVPIIKRVGLRYIDECPVVKKDNKTFEKWFNTAYPLDRFNIADAIEMDFRVSIKKKDYIVRYVEALKKVQKSDKYVLILDFDSYAQNIKPKECLKITDDLHDLIAAEYENTIKKPVYDFMKKEKENKK